MSCTVQENYIQKKNAFKVDQYRLMKLRALDQIIKDMS